MQDKGENILVWNEDRKGSFRVKPYYSSLCSKTRVDFPAKEIQGSQAPLTMLFFHLGSNMGEDFNYRHVNEEGVING